MEEEVKKLDRMSEITLDTARMHSRMCDEEANSRG
jgi:hypothetical protein